VNETVWAPPSEKDFAAAKRLYLETHGSLAVMNTYLKVAVLALSVTCAGSVALNLRTLEFAASKPPFIVRVNEVGRAEVVRYDASAMQPQEPEIKFFLIDFVQRHYSRMRATLRDNYARSLYFLDARLTDGLVEANRKSKELETFLAGDGAENDVDVKRVSIEDLRTSPYRATVDFEKVFYAPDRTVSRREKHIANVVFVMKDRVPNAMIPINPLGLTITYFRDDQSFN